MKKTCALLLLLNGSVLQAQDLADLFARVSPGVVTIRTVESELTKGEAPHLEQHSLIGTGVLLDRAGTVLTAAHVVKLADAVSIEFRGGKRLLATITAIETGADLALIRAQGELPEGAVPCSLGDSSAVRVGNQVFVVGTPLGMGYSLTSGYISGIRRDETYLGGMRFVQHFQTDAAINPGNSGGPLFDMRGEVIGVVCHVVTSKMGSEGLGFAITSKAVRELLLERPKAWLGFDALPLSPVLSRALNVPKGRVGLLVSRVSKSSPAFRAGLRAGRLPVRYDGRELVLGGDIILEMLGHELSDPRARMAIEEDLDAFVPGSEIRFTVLREGEVLELSTEMEK